MTMGSSLNKASPLRIALIVAVLIGVCVAALQLVSVPVRQIYWGLYGRVRPLVSENNLAVLEEKLLGTVVLVPRSTFLASIQWCNTPNLLLLENLPF